MAAETGIVVEKKTSGSGTPMLKIGTNWYVAGRLDVSGVNVGHRITFEWIELPNRDPSRPAMRGIQSWAFTPDQPTPQEVESAKAAAVPKGKPFVKGGGGGWKGQDRGLEIDLQCMRFVGQCVAGLIEKGLISGPDGLKEAAKKAWDAISFTRVLGGTAPAPATPSSEQANATSAGSPQQSPQGGRSAPPQAPRTFEGGKGPRPTGLFGYGQKYRDTPWNVLQADTLKFFLHGKDGQGSNAPADVKQMCADELWYREQEKLRADQVQQSMADPNQDDWSDDIPF